MSFKMPELGFVPWAKVDVDRENCTDNYACFISPIHLCTVCLETRGTRSKQHNISMFDMGGCLAGTLCNEGS